MQIFRRILLTLFLLCGIFAAGVVLACAWGLIDIVQPSDWLSMLYGNTVVVIVASVVGVALVLIGLVLMFSRTRRREPKAALIKDTGIGGISITLSALEEMAVRHIMESAFVRNVRVGVAVKDAKVNLAARMGVKEDTNIPEVLSSLQASLKAHIELLAGIETGKITLLVEKSSQAQKRG